jgi:DNA polymerase-3 subunit alpha
MSNYTLFHCHSEYSLLDGYSKPKDIVKRAKELGMKAIGISDHGTVAGHVELAEEAKKEGIKPILGIELYCALDPAPLKKDRSNTHMVCFARNESGLKDLWKMASYSNEPELFYYRPRINLENWVHPETKKLYYGIEHFAKNNGIIFISGHQGSFLSDFLFCDLFGDPKKRSEDIRKAYSQYKEKDIDFYRQFLKDGWLEKTCEFALKMETLLGKGNLLIEIQDELNPKDKLPLWIHPLITECLRKVSDETNIPKIASSDPHYAYPEDYIDQRLMVSINMKETEESIDRKMSESGHDVFVFFGSTNFYIHSIEEMSKKFTKEELDRTNEIADQIEDYNITKAPKIPAFTLPEFPKDAKYLKDIEKDKNKCLLHLVIEAAKNKKPWETNKKNIKEDYWNRIKEEFDIIVKANLADYLLIVWDFMSFCRYRPADGSFDWMNNLKKDGKIDKIYTGIGRGSVGGSLICYFLGIHGVDPLKYNLLFSRFFNPARLKDLMDIDTDVEAGKRDLLIDYLSYKYGSDKIAQISTYGRIQGRAAIKDIFRVKGVENAFEIANKISEYIPDEAKIADELQEVRDSGEDYQIIEWAIDNNKELEPFYKEYKELFDQAIRVEGTKRNQSRHASGFVITTEPIEELFPMILDTKSKKKIINLGMNEAAKTSAVKIDILGLNLLDKLSMCQRLVNG